ncbi:30S ribosomal protein S4 [Candidatus Micrarchaeota archaeon]|nr:30S ribosomal protein S4 [Candidatus Micrarchaeota archaeon]
MGKKRLRKEYEKPKKLWNKERIERESKLETEFGLKNARELWRMQTILRKIRREARTLLSKKGEATEHRSSGILDRVKTFLIRKQDATLDDVLSLDVRDILNRRLQTIVSRKGMAGTIKQARQFITHGHVAIAGKKITSPSYLVRFNEEDRVSWYKKTITMASQREESKELSVEESGDPKEVKAGKTQ